MKADDIKTGELSATSMSTYIPNRLCAWTRTNVMTWSLFTPKSLTNLQFSFLFSSFSYLSLIFILSIC